jgi:GT2 family glycosyltransferase
MGVGAQFGSCEETDLLLNLLNKNVKLIFIPEIQVHHPLNYKKYNSNLLRRSYYSALGRDAILRKHLTFRFWYIYQFAFSFVRPLIAGFLYYNKGTLFVNIE